jgi:hypothetical protein
MYKIESRYAMQALKERGDIFFLLILDIGTR